MDIYVTKGVRVVTELSGLRSGSFVLQHHKPTGWGKPTWYPRIDHVFAALLKRGMWQDASAPEECTLEEAGTALDHARSMLVKLSHQLRDETAQVVAEVTGTAIGGFDDLDDV